MSDEKILDIKDFKKVGDEIIRKYKTKENPENQKNQGQTSMQNDDDFDIEEEIMLLIEEIEILRFNIFQEKLKRQTTEKILNKVLKQLTSNANHAINIDVPTQEEIKNKD